jgi:L-alanine-DL-glutamate epimerase-like enolase superfamily enzyme
MKTGGISNAIRIADIAALHGIECMIGCMLESSISVAAAVHLAGGQGRRDHQGRTWTARRCRSSTRSRAA